MRAKETHTRSFIKSLTYRVYSSFIVTPIVSYLVTRNFIISLTLGITEFLIKPFTYFLFERIWSHIKWGYKPPKYDILEKVFDNK